MTVKPRPDLPLNARILAALADVPADKRPHFGKIARQLHVAPAQITVGVVQLVSSGRLDRNTLKPKRPEIAPKPRSYCRFPDHCVAAAVGPCSKCPTPGGTFRPKGERAAPAQFPRPSLTPRAADRLNALDQALVWCGQCDRRVAVSRALGCVSRFCKAELPPHQRECKL